MYEIQVNIHIQLYRNVINTFRHMHHSKLLFNNVFKMYFRGPVAPLVVADIFLQKTLRSLI